MSEENKENLEAVVDIVFVDDDPHVLHGLKCMLRDMRHTWNMHFCNSGQEALKLMETRSFDIIVSDMRMPEMDGATLLTTVKKLYPGTTRIILSGYSDEKMILKTVDSADQFLSKPCKKEELIGVVEQSIDTRAVFKGREFVMETIASMDHLPTIPSLYLELKKLLESEKSSLKEVSDVIKIDVTMSAKILQLVNSAFFGLRHRIVNVHQATVYLGVRTIKAIVIMADVFSNFTETEMEVFSIEAMYTHSVTVSSLAREIASTVSAEIVDDVGMAAILHDIGKIIFIRNKFDIYKKFFNKESVGKMPIHLMEKAVLGVTHAEAGSYLMGVWGIPQEVVKAIALHHGEEKTDSKVANILRLSNALVHVVGKKNAQENNPKDDFYKKYLERLFSEAELAKGYEIADAVLNSKD